MRAKTIRLTVLCPFCQTSYTFKKEETKNKWNGKDPLHSLCKKEMMK